MAKAVRDELALLDMPLGANPSHGLGCLCYMTGYKYICIFLLHRLHSATSFLPLQAFGHAYSNQRKAAADGENNEETLLQESALKEAYYMGRILVLQTEVTRSRCVAFNAQGENEGLNTLTQDLREVSGSTTAESSFCRRCISSWRTHMTS